MAGENQGGDPANTSEGDSGDFSDSGDSGDSGLGLGGLGDGSGSGSGDDGGNPGDGSGSGSGDDGGDNPGDGSGSGSGDDGGDNPGDGSGSGSGSDDDGGDNSGDGSGSGSGDDGGTTANNEVIGPDGLNDAQRAFFEEAETDMLKVHVGQMDENEELILALGERIKELWQMLKIASNSGTTISDELMKRLLQLLIKWRSIRDTSFRKSTKIGKDFLEEYTVDSALGN